MNAEPLALLIAGAAVGGFVNGLAGFGTALFALGFWLQAFPPVQAVAMIVVTASVTGLQGLWLVRREVLANPRRLLRFLIPALIGIPAGAALLTWIDPHWLKLAIAALMLIYGGFFLFRRSLPAIEAPTPMTDAGIGLVGGVMGGLAGLSGALPAMWCALRPWPKRETRAVLQPFNMAVLTISAVLLALRGAYTPEVLGAMAIAMVVAISAAQAGIMVFHRLGDHRFRRLLIGLMFVSGAVLGVRELGL